MATLRCAVGVHANDCGCQSPEPEGGTCSQRIGLRTRRHNQQRARARSDHPASHDTVELASGQSFALAGLLLHDTSQDISKVPWLGDIPVLGALFRSNSFNNNESELVVIVTPYLVRPPAVAAAAPTDGFKAPHDA